MILVLLPRIAHARNEPISALPIPIQVEASGEIRCTVSKGRKPRTYVPASEHKAVNVCGVLAAVDSDTYHNTEEQHKHNDFYYHFNVPPNIKL